MAASRSDAQFIQALVTRFQADPNCQFSAQEAEALIAAAPEDIWAAKAAMLHCFRNGAMERALTLTQSIAEREPSAESLKNVVVALRSLGRLDEAIAVIEEDGASMDPIERCDLLCSLHSRAGNIDSAVACGNEALALKDAAAGAAPLTEPVIRRFDPTQRSRNVISFSLWGNDERYLNGAITNTIVARYLYPGWTPRFYIDESVPEQARQLLVQNGAQLVTAMDLPAAHYGLFWRFLVEDDPDVDIYIVRDADSVSNIKERWAVADWLKSGQAFHVMRDYPMHSELILAGMWGAHRGNIVGMRDRIEAAVKSGRNVANNITLDQQFLRTVIWPIARNSVRIHDSCFSFMSPTRYSPDFDLPAPIHIGQNDWVNFRKETG